jgi:hypothetical protein
VARSGEQCERNKCEEQLCSGGGHGGVDKQCIRRRAQSDTAGHIGCSDSDTGTGFAYAKLSEIHSSRRYRSRRQDDRNAYAKLSEIPSTALRTGSSSPRVARVVGMTEGEARAARFSQDYRQIARRGLRTNPSRLVPNCYSA